MAEEEKNEAEEQAEGDAPAADAGDAAAKEAAAPPDAADEAPDAADAADGGDADGADGGDAEGGGEAEAAPAPAAAAEESADEEAPEELTPKQRRKLARSTHSGEPGPELSTEERVERRAAERSRKAAARRRYRKGRGADRARAAGAGSGTGTEPAVREPGNPKVRQGIVVSDKGDKTITVRVESARRHPSYEKVIRTSKMYHAHDERNEAGAGDTVRLVETRPMSKTKRWRLTEILEKAK